MTILSDLIRRKPPDDRRLPRSLVPGPWSLAALRLGYGGLILALIGLNARWWWSDRPPVEMKAIDVWTARGRLDDAERALRDLLRRSPDHGEARMKLARLLARHADYLGCAEQLHRVPYWWPAKAEALFLEAQAYKLIDRARDAEAAWKACIADDPLHPVPPRIFHGAARELIGLYILEGRLDEARRTVWRAYEASDRADRPGILVMRMRAELERIAHEEAVAKLRRYVGTTPDDWEARRALALEEQWAGDQAAANRHMAACLKARPADPVVWRTWLEILDQRGDHDGIQAALARLPPSAGGDAEIWKFRGLARVWAGDLAGAAEAFARAARLNPYEGEYFYRLGISEHRLGRPDQARQHTQHSHELRQAEAQLHDAYFDYLKISQKATPGDADYQAAVRRLASLCEQLGWKREADAWRQVLSEGGRA